MCVDTSCLPSWGPTAMPCYRYGSVTPSRPIYPRRFNKGFPIHACMSPSEQHEQTYCASWERQPGNSRAHHSSVPRMPQVRGRAVPCPARRRSYAARCLRMGTTKAVFYKIHTDTIYRAYGMASLVFYTTVFLTFLVPRTPPPPGTTSYTLI
jgi:hypothetical protein